MLEGGGIKMSFRENVEQIPVIKHKFSYVLMIILFLLLLKTPFLYWTGLKEQGIMFSHCAFLLFSAINEQRKIVIAIVMIHSS